MTECSPSSGVYRRTPADHCHRAGAALLVEHDGWHVPSLYSTATQEEAAIREGIALVDLSALRKVGYYGRDVREAVAPLSARTRVPAREAVWVDAERTGLACRLGDDSHLVVATTTDHVATEPRLATVSIPATTVQHDLTSTYAAIGLLGPRFEPVLQRLCATNVSPLELRPGTCMETNLAGVHAALIRPDGLVVPFVWICVAWDVGEYVWRTLRSSGADVQPIGLDTWQKAIRCKPAV